MTAAPSDTADIFALLAAQEQTWPPEHAHDIAAAGAPPAWRARWTIGAGRRVASARPLVDAGDALEAALDGVAAYYRDHGDDILLQSPDLGTGDLDARLRAYGFAPEAPTLFAVAPISTVAEQPVRNEDPRTVVRLAVPLAAAHAFWRENDVSAARQAVMARATDGAVFVGRLQHRIAAAVFVACAEPPTGRDKLVMAHALVVAPEARRRGLAQDVLIAVARWALSIGADQFVADVEEANAPARALFARMGCVEVGGYRYYRAPSLAG